MINRTTIQRQMLRAAESCVVLPVCFEHWPPDRCLQFAKHAFYSKEDARTRTRTSSSSRAVSSVIAQVIGVHALVGTEGAMARTNNLSLDFFRLLAQVKAV